MFPKLAFELWKARCLENTGGGAEVIVLGTSPPRPVGAGFRTPISLLYAKW